MMAEPMTVATGSRPAGRVAGAADMLLPWLLWLLLLTIPFSEALKNILFGLTALAWLLARGWQTPAGPLRWLGYLVMVAVLSAVSALSPREALNGAFDCLRIFLCGLCALRVAANERRAVATLAVAAAGTAAAAAWAMFSVKMGWLNFGSAGLKVMSLGFANHSATYLLLATLAALTLLPRGGRMGWLAAAALLPLLAGLWLTSSRGAWVAAVLVLLLFLLRHATRRICLTIGVIAIVMVPVVLHSEQALVQLENFGRGGEVGWRARMWQDCVPVISERLWLGVGARNFKMLDPERYLRVWAYSDHAHNTLVNLAVELGLAGLACYLGLLAAAIRNSLRLPREWRFLPQGAVLAMLVAGMATTTLHTEGGMLFAVLLGTAAARTAAETPAG
ncbi:MAG TPA: O-antigen ligase family protein [bacterium]|nr:O-antigen ligase family protein [bacterium]